MISRNARTISDLNLQRRAFWAYFAEALPDLFARTERGNESSRWLAVGPSPLIVAHYVSATGVGVFVRGERGTKIGLVRESLFPHRRLLSEMLGREDIRLGGIFLLGDRFRCDMAQAGNWAAAVRWFAEKSPLYERALYRLQQGGIFPPGPDLP